MELEIVNQEAIENEIGGDVACIAACAGLCYLSSGVATAMALALVQL